MNCILVTSARFHLNSKVFLKKDKNRELHGIGKKEHQFWKEKKKSFTFLRQESNVNCTDVEKNNWHYFKKSSWGHYHRKFILYILSGIPKESTQTYQSALLWRMGLLNPMLSFHLYFGWSAQLHAARALKNSNTFFKMVLMTIWF